MRIAVVYWMIKKDGKSMLWIDRAFRSMDAAQKYIKLDVEVLKMKKDFLKREGVTDLTFKIREIDLIEE